MALRAHGWTTLLAIAMVFPAALPLPAQASSGRIVGRIIDATTGQGLADVGVQVVGTTLGVSSGVDGRYTLPAIPAGTVTLQVRRLGFQPKTVTGILLAAGKTLEQDITMDAAGTIEDAAFLVERDTITGVGRRGEVTAPGARSTG